MKKVYYVLGFYFNNDMNEVLLIEKKKPKWQLGLLNGLGGKIEGQETAPEAMRREFLEECGIDVPEWNQIAIMGGDDWQVTVLYSVEPDDIKFKSAEQLEAEELHYVPIGGITDRDCVSNLQWLIPLCYDKICFENTSYSTTVNF